MTDYKAEPSAHEDVYNAPRKGGVMNKLYPPGPDGKGRVKNHCLKFWWCDLLVTIIIVLVVLLPTIFVAIPHKAQSEINKSTLEVLSQDVTNPQPDSIHLKLYNVIKSDSSYHPTVDSFPASLTLDGQTQPFLQIIVPKAKSEKETYVTVDQDITLQNKDAFTLYTKTVLGAETFKVHLNGKTKVHLKGLPAMSVNYNKVVTMKGLNQLQGLNISDIKILSGQSEILPDGSNMIGTVHIPNPSVMTLDLGNTTMNLAVGDKSIGYSLLPNLVLKPGQNKVPMQARVDQLAVLGLVQNQYKNAVLPLSISGNSSISNDKTLPYYTAAIKSNLVKLDLNVAPALAGIGINITNSS